jgi:hypothetical protein
MPHPAFSVRSKRMLLQGTVKKKPQKLRLVPPRDIRLKFAVIMCALSALSALSRPRRRQSTDFSDHGSGIHTYINPMHFDFVQEDLNIFLYQPAYFIS